MTEKLLRGLRFVVFCWLCVCGLSYAEPLTHQPTGIVFPDELAGFQRTEASDMESKQRGLGFSYTYRSPDNVVATVYVYTAGVANIPADPAGPIVHQLREHTIKEIFQYAERFGETPRPSMKATVKVKTEKGEVPVLFDGFTVNSPQSGTRSTYLWLWAARGHFLKIRLTHPPAATADFKHSIAFHEAVVRLTVD
jgi:hypothetical protein